MNSPSICDPRRRDAREPRQRPEFFRGKVHAGTAHFAANCSNVGEMSYFDPLPTFGLSVTMVTTAQGATMLTRRTALLGLTSSALLFPKAAAAQLKTTPTGDLGPFYPIVRGPDADSDLTLVKGRTGKATGQIIEVSGRVLDSIGKPVPGAVIELWQANAAGRYAHPSDTNPASLDPDFQGFAKLISGRDGSYRYTSIKPGAYPDGDDSPRPPHVHLDVSGKTDRIVTQMLFPGEPLNMTDDVVPEWARGRLTATAMGQATTGALRFSWDIILDHG